MGTASVFFNGTSSYLELAPTSKFAIPTYTTPFTIECWLYPLRGDATIFSEQYTGAGDTISIQIGFSDSTGADTAGTYLTLANYNGGSWIATTSNTQVTLNTWTHVAFVCTGSTSKIFINGIDCTKTSNPTPITMWGMINDNGDSWYIGRRWDSYTRTFYQGYISNFRFVVGTAVYNENFTVPTSELTVIANTQLLACASLDGYIDNSPNNFTITNVGAALTLANPFRANYLGDGMPVGENFDPSLHNEAIQNWSHTSFGFRY